MLIHIRRDEEGQYHASIVGTSIVASDYTEKHAVRELSNCLEDDLASGEIDPLTEIRDLKSILYSLEHP